MKLKNAPFRKLLRQKRAQGFVSPNSRPFMDTRRRFGRAEWQNVIGHLTWVQL